MQKQKIPGKFSLVQDLLFPLTFLYQIQGRNPKHYTREMNPTRAIQSPPIAFFVLVLVILCLLLRGPISGPVGTGLHNDQSNPDGRRLLQVLRRAAMPSRIIILTMVDKSWARPGSVLDLFLDSFRIGQGTGILLNHVLVFALDAQAFEFCESVHPHCFHLTTSVFGHAKGKPVKSLNQMRNQLLAQVLKHGYNFVYTDADVMWLRNPFPILRPYEAVTIGCDSYWGYESRKASKPSGGFFFVAPDLGKSMEFFKIWNFARAIYPDIQDQPLCDMFRPDDMVMYAGLHVKFLETKYYGGFCQPSSDLSRVYTIHANCCDDLESKIHDLKLVLEDLKKIRAISYNSSSSSFGTFSYSGRAPRKCLTR